MNAKDGIYLRTLDPVGPIVLVICILGAVLTANYYIASAALGFIVAGVLSVVYIWRRKRQGIVLVLIENGDLVFPERVDTPNKQVRMKVADIREISVAGLPDDRRFRFAMNKGETIMVRPYFPARHSEKVLVFLKAHFGHKVPIRVKGALNPLEEMRGEVD
jgi:hypothetical protein